MNNSLISPPQNRRCWHCLVLAVLLAFLTANVCGQGVIYGHFPITGAQGGPFDPWDSRGYRMIGGAAMYYSVDLNNDGVVDYVFSSGTSFDITPAGENKVIAVHPTDTELSSFVIPLAAGFHIGPNANPYGWLARVDTPFGSLGSTFSATRDIGSIGYFNGLESAYAGLQFTIDGQTHYGWVRVGVPVVGFNGGWIYDYAYESAPNTPILAGVPEPSTWILLWGGVVLLWHHRRAIRK